MESRGEYRPKHSTQELVSSNQKGSRQSPNRSARTDSVQGEGEAIVALLLQLQRDPRFRKGRPVLPDALILDLLYI
jgi:hypothetical protein